MHEGGAFRVGRGAVIIETMAARVIIEPSYHALLQANGMLDFDAVMQRRADGPRASTHRFRETSPVRLGEQLFFLKRTFRVPGKHIWRDLARRLVPRCQPWREWEAIGLLAGASLPVMKRAAVGERRVGGLPTAGFLLVEAAGGVNTAADWLRPGGSGRAALSARARHQLLRELGRLQGRMRQNGFVWPDAHPRHVFAEPDESAAGGWRFCLIDVERVEQRSGSETIELTPLAKLLRRCLPFEPTRFEQLAFLSGARAATRSPFVAVGADDAAMLLPHSRGVAIHAPPEDREGTSHPVELAKGLWITPRDAPLLKSAGLDTVEGLFRFADGRLLDKRGLERHRQRIRLELGNGSGRAVYYLKRVMRPPLREQVARVVQGAAWDSSAWREWHFIRRLTEIGIPTMRCAALAAEMSGGWERRSALVTAAVPGESLERWLPREWAGLSRPRRLALVGQVAAVARILHLARLFHRDLYLSHLFVDWPSPERPVVHVIDLARMLERPRRAWRWQIKDLAALHYSAPAGLVSRTDRVRFLRLYAPWVEQAARGRSRHGIYLTYARAIAARAERMARHDAKRAGAVRPAARTV